MNHNNILSRIELIFWNFTISALSQSGSTRSILRRTARFLYDSEAASLGILLGISGVVGLVSGYLFFFVAQSLR
jgi:hypothetical protein